jgi:hypothetical protein
VMIVDHPPKKLCNINAGKSLQSLTFY